MTTDGFVYVGLLGLLGIFFIMQLKMMFFPQVRGKIIEFESIFDGDCSSCRGKRQGKTSFPIKVETESGDVVSAEISCCTICIEKMTVGSRVGITKVGDRQIAQACSNLRGRNN